MLILKFILIVFAVVQATTEPDQRATFIAYMQQFSKSYPTDEEFNYRFKNWQITEKYIISQRQQGIPMNHNKFSDWSQEEKDLRMTRKPDNTPKNEDCKPGFRITNNGCEKCANGCNCNSQSKCVSCVSDKFIYDSGKCVCAAEMYYNSTIDDCQSCGEGQYYNGKSCKTCSASNCIKCMQNKCLECALNFTNTDGKCKCMGIHNTTAETCKPCENNQYFRLGYCRNCSSNCSKCSGPNGNCIECFDKSFVIQGDACKCPTETHFINNDGHCEKIVTCEIGKYNTVNNTCLSCGQLCRSCDSITGSCNTCIEKNMEIVNQKSQIYHISPVFSGTQIGQCRCPPKSYLDGNQCTQLQDCKLGSYNPGDDKCVKCPANCAQCTAFMGLCLKCNDNTFNKTLLKLNGTCQCNSDSEIENETCVPKSRSEESFSCSQCTNLTGRCSECKIKNILAKLTGQNSVNNLTNLNSKTDAGSSIFNSLNDLTKTVSTSFSDITEQLTSNSIQNLTQFGQKSVLNLSNAGRNLGSSVINSIADLQKLITSSFSQISNGAITSISDLAFTSTESVTTVITSSVPGATKIVKNQLKSLFKPIGMKFLKNKIFEKVWSFILLLLPLAVVFYKFYRKPVIQDLPIKPVDINQIKYSLNESDFVKEIKEIALKFEFEMDNLLSDKDKDILNLQDNLRQQEELIGSMPQIVANTGIEITNLKEIFNRQIILIEKEKEGIIKCKEEFSLKMIKQCQSAISNANTELDAFILEQYGDEQEIKQAYQLESNQIQNNHKVSQVLGLQKEVQDQKLDEIISVQKSIIKSDKLEDQTKKTKLDVAKIKLRKTEQWAKSKGQNWQYPNSVDLDYNRHVVGVSTFQDRFNFLFSDNSTTNLSVSAIQAQFIDQLIEPQESVVYRITMQYDASEEPYLVGVKFMDKKGKNLLKAGMIDKSSRKSKSAKFIVEEYILKEGERLIGISSRQEAAKHFGFRFIIGSLN